MVALAERSPLRVGWLALVLVFPLAVSAWPQQDQTQPTGPTRECNPLRRELVLEPAALSIDAVHVRAQLRYERQQFSAAAAVVRDALARMPASADATDLESLATLYDQLAAAWATGMDPATPAATAFPALREAWKLDTVLGGAFSDPLHARLAEVAPKAAVAFVAQRDYPAAELALHTAEALGVTSDSLAAVEQALAKHR
jgi:hypothetical protein